MDYTLNAYENAPLTVEQLRHYLEREESIIEIRKSRDCGQDLASRYFHSIEVHEIRIKVLKMRIAVETSLVNIAIKELDI